jgi:hypothetical protein
MISKKDLAPLLIRDGRRDRFWAGHGALNLWLLFGRGDGCASRCR